MTRLKDVAAVIAGQSPPSEAVGPVEHGIPFLQGNAEFGRRTPSAKYECAEAPKACKAGDILLSVRAPVGAVNVADRQYGIGRGLCAVRPKSALQGFLWWWLLDQRSRLTAAATGSTFDAVTASVVGALDFPSFTLDEQRAIAEFLDRETARIDTLIEEQERLIDLLRERRMTTLAAGLATAGPTTRLKHRATVQSGVTLNGDGDPEFPEWPYLRVANVQVGRVDLGEIKTIRLAVETASNYLLRKGDVLMTEGGDIDKLGRGALWSGDISTMLHQNHVFAVRPSTQLVPQYLVYWLDGPVARRYFIETAKQTTNLASTNKWTLGNLPVPDLAPTEQWQIVRELDSETAKLDELVAEAERLITLARERRAALITAAVTGQIDVRESEPVAA